MQIFLFIMQISKIGFKCRVICESLLNSDELSIDSSQKWCETFYLVRRIIGGVYYKVILITNAEPFSAFVHHMSKQSH